MKKQILVKGPVLSQSGYGEQSRFALRALRSREDIFDILIYPTTWGQTGWVWEEDEFREWIDQRIRITQLLSSKKQLRPDISLQITIPNEFENMCPVNIGYTAGIETTMVAAPWIDKGNLMDKILVVSNHAKATYQNTILQMKNDITGETKESSLKTPVEVVWENTVRQDPEPIPNLELKTDFNFLMVSQMGPRKNFHNAVKWWVEEFFDQDVGLIIKTNLKNNSQMDFLATNDAISSFLSQYPDRKCKVYLLHGDLSAGQMTWLYSHSKVKAMVNIAHGEGFGLPLFEAAREELPIVTLAWSGQQDFLIHNGEKYFEEVFFNLDTIQAEAVWPGVLDNKSQWAFADQGSYKMALRKTLKNWDKAKERSKKLSKLVDSKFNNNELYKHFCNQFYNDETQNVTLDQIPKISLITSVFKADDYIEQLMEDVTRQTIFEEKCEWVILNANPEGHNTEEEIIKKYMEKYPNNIVYKRLEEDPGIYETWNIGIKMSTGEFVTNVNCDDRRAPWGLEKQAASLVVNPDVDLVYNDSYITHEPNIMWESVKPDSQRYNFEEFSKDAMIRGNLPHNNPMWRKSLHEANGYFDAKYRSAGDWEFFLRCTFAGSKFKKINEPLGVYYFNPTGMSTNVEHNSWKREEEKEIFKKYMKVFQEQQVANKEQGKPNDRGEMFKI